MIPTLIQPSNESLDVDVDSERSRFINKLEAGSELQTDDAAALLMGIANAHSNLDEHAGIIIRSEACTNLRPIPTEMMQKFQSVVDPLIDNTHRQAGQHWID